MSLIKVENLKKIYSSDQEIGTYVALNDVSFEVEEGEFVAIMGESGSGKTTLLNTLSLIENSTFGNITINETNVIELNSDEKVLFRRDNMGIILQDYDLIETITVRENIRLALVIKQLDDKVIDNRIASIAKELEIENILEKKASSLSGGQKQMVAAARALASTPRIIFADEPTAALDSKKARMLMNTFRKINNAGQTILMVTHSVLAASCAKRVLFIKDSKIYHQIYKGQMSENEMYKMISDTLNMLL